MALVRRDFLCLMAGSAGAAVAPRIARAQGFPARPITLYVGAAAGGPTDVIGRLVADHIRGPLGQPIIIENNGAAGDSSFVRLANRFDPLSSRENPKFSKNCRSPSAFCGMGNCWGHVNLPGFCIRKSVCNSCCYRY